MNQVPKFIDSRICSVNFLSEARENNLDASGVPAIDARFRQPGAASHRLRQE